MRYRFGILKLLFAHCFLTMCCVLIPNVATAQNTTDFGAIIRLADVEELNDNWSLAAKEDLRFNNDIFPF